MPTLLPLVAVLMTTSGASIDGKVGVIKTLAFDQCIDGLVPLCCYMMTSLNGNIVRVTGPLWWEFTSCRWIPLTKGQWRGALIFSLICAWTNEWVNNRDAGDLRRHRAHYDVTVMIIQINADTVHPIEHAHGFIEISYGCIISAWWIHVLQISLAFLWNCEWHRTSLMIGQHCFR